MTTLSSVSRSKHVSDTYETVVIGLGSPLMGDDGLGIVALERVRDGWHFTPHVEFVDGGTWGMNLLHFIEGAEAVIFVDAIKTGAVPGCVVVLERCDLPMFLNTKLSPHQIDLREVLALAEFRGTLPDRTVAIGLEPDRIEMMSGVSNAVATSIPALCHNVVTRLKAWGHVATPAPRVVANA